MAAAMPAQRDSKGGEVTDVLASGPRVVGRFA